MPASPAGRARPRAGVAPAGAVHRLAPHAARGLQRGVALPPFMRHRRPSRRRRVRSSRARIRRGGPAVVLSGHTHGHIQVSAPSILGLGFIMRFGDFLNEI